MIMIMPNTATRYTAKTRSAEWLKYVQEQYDEPRDFEMIVHEQCDESCSWPPPSISFFPNAQDFWCTQSFTLSWVPSCLSRLPWLAWFIAVFDNLSPTRRDALSHRPADIGLLISLYRDSTHRSLSDRLRISFPWCGIRCQSASAPLELYMALKRHWKTTSRQPSYCISTHKYGPCS